MTTSTIPKKVFISYSWSTIEHDDWVLSLAHQLIGDGVNVVLDKWDLKEGQDKFYFMESMVTSPDIDKVLMICDKKYADKADNRSGGVGTETQIITPQIYNQTNQAKFIPIVAEVDQNNQPYLPAYLKSLIYIDLSTTEKHTLEYEKLLRNIYNRPSLSKPKLGKAPSYLFEDSPVTFKTTSMIRGMNSQLERFPERINLFAKDFLTEFDRNLREFKIDDPATTSLELGKQILDKLTQYTPLRDDYIYFIDKLTKNNWSFDTTILLRFIENLPLNLAPREEGYNSWQPAAYEHYKFINHELFIYTTALALKNENYSFLEQLLLSKYFFKSRGMGRVVPQDFDVIRNHFDLCDQYYKQSTGRNYYNVHAEILMSRVPDLISKDEFAAGDVFCYFIAQLNGTEWFPTTYSYCDTSYFDFFNRLISRRRFEKVKNLLGVELPEEFKAKLEVIITAGPETGYSLGRGRLPSIEQYIQPNDIASTK